MHKLGWYVSLLLSVVTLITFGIAIFTTPLSGPFCPGDCFQYPYTDIISRFPRDYYWMFFALFQVLIYLVFMGCLYQWTSPEKKIFGLIGWTFGIGAAVILFVDYFVQITVIQPSLLNGETMGISLWTQFNPHGLFIALEEAGYLLMGGSFAFISRIFTGTNRFYPALRWIFGLGFVLVIFTFVLISIVYGVHREYRFEVFSLTIDWWVLIGAGILMSRVFADGRSPAREPANHRGESHS